MKIIASLLANQLIISLAGQELKAKEQAAEGSHSSGFHPGCSQLLSRANTGCFLQS